MTKRLKSIVVHSTRVLLSKKKNKRRVVRNNKFKRSKQSNSNIWIGFGLLKMIKYRKRQATEPKKLKKLSTVVFSIFVSRSGSG